MQLSDKVEEVIQEFVSRDVLFTALDVSNKVKEAMPTARHREVRDLVRAAFSVLIEPAAYARTPIKVQLPDGSQAEAQLYHPLSDSWDLDAKYDAQKRAQSTVRPSAVTPVAVPVQAQATVANIVAAQTQPVVSAAPVAPAVQNNVRVLWDSMFKSQPSLLPRK